MRAVYIAIALLGATGCADDRSGDDLPPGAFTSGPADSGAGDLADTGFATSDGADDTTDAPGTEDTAPGDETGPPAMVSFEAELQPLFESTCFGAGCHDAAAPAGTLNLSPEGTADPYDELTMRSHGLSGMPYVTVGDPADSYLYRKLEGTHLEDDLENLGNGAQMPLNATPLTPTELQLVRDWILSGAMR